MCVAAAVLAASRTVPRERSLPALRPDLVAQLHPTRNGSLDPATLGAGSAQKVWWTCVTCGHEWRAAVSNRSQGGGCPPCGRRAANDGNALVPLERSLRHLAPQLIAELDPERNPPLNPETVAAKSSRKLWWRCLSCAHRWQAPPASRLRGHGCPRCGRARGAETRRRTTSIVPERSLAVKFPQLATELHPDRNGDLDPWKIAAMANLSVWWKCNRCDYEWRTRPSHRSAGSGCPRCARHRKR